MRLICFNATSTTSICSPMDQGVISTFMSYFFRNRNAFCKALSVIDCNSSDVSRQSKRKNFWRGFTILDAIKNINDS